MRTLKTIDDREDGVFYIDAREKNKNGVNRGLKVLDHMKLYAQSNKKYADDLSDYIESNVVTDKQLPIGDYVKDGVCVEVKEYNTTDLQDSIQNGRLATQSHELHNSKDPQLHKKPFKDCRIIIMANCNGYNHICNAPQLSKGLLNFSGETPVNFVNYTNTNNPKWNNNAYCHLAEAIIHLNGMNGRQIGRQSTVSMMRNENSAVTYCLSMDTLNKTQSKALCKGEHLHSWNDANDWFNEFNYTNTPNKLYKKITMYTSNERLAKSTVAKVCGRKAVRELDSK